MRWLLVIAVVPVESAALPELIPQIGWPDQWSFWQFGWPGIMVTDTAPFRNPHYHLPSDRPETVDYDRLARVTQGLVAVRKSWAGCDDTSRVCRAAEQ